MKSCSWAPKNKKILYKLFMIRNLCHPSFIFLCVIFSSSFSTSLSAKHLHCDVPAPTAILINADTGVVLFEKNAHTPTYPASTTKVATALYALNEMGNSSLDEHIKASHEAVSAVTPATRRNSGKHPSYRLEFGGTHMGLKFGEIMTFRSLMYGLMLVSGNDAANAIAEFVAGDVPTFMEGLNMYLQEIGCVNTHFTNPHGLSDSRHVTTAYDLAQMTLHAMKHPFFREVVKTTRYTRPKTNKQEESYLVQFNALLRPGKHFYPHAIGVKTGYTDAAGRNLVAAAEKDGRRVIAVVLNCTDMSQRYRSCINLFEAAFNEMKVKRKLFSQQHDAFTISLKGAESPLEAILQKDVIVEYYPSEESKLHAKLRWAHVNLPVAQGDVVGEMQILNDKGVVVLSEPLFAKKDVAPTVSYKVGKCISFASVVMRTYRHWIGLSLGLTFVALAYALKPRKKKSVN